MSNQNKILVCCTAMLVLLAVLVPVVRWLLIPAVLVGALASLARRNPGIWYHRRSRTTGP